ncbi:uncharacterized protein [Typha angustifolia]|uniref:uncharacterized protein isoform X2 n=1 Tax=Typha angustifolia TaxID=59011 RepID=UPI003C2F0073
MKPAALLLPQSQWSHLLPFSFSSTPKHSTSFSCLAPSIAGGGGEPTARERRQLRQEKRESRAGSVNWREEVEERLLHKPKKRSPASWTEDLNLDLLARLGPQWWVVRVSRVTGEEIAQRLARLLARNFPQLEFKVYYPAVREKKKLKNGTYNVKSKPLFAGCVFLHCVLNKDIHDFIRECDGVGGFVGSRVGNTPLLDFRCLARRALWIWKLIKLKWLLHNGLVPLALASHSAKTSENTDDHIWSCGAFIAFQLIKNSNQSLGMGYSLLCSCN